MRAFKCKYGKMSDETDVTVNVWIEDNKTTVGVNLSDYEGDFSMNCAKFRKLPECDRKMLRAMGKEAKAECVIRIEQQIDANERISAKYWSLQDDGFITAGGTEGDYDPIVLIECGLGGTVEHPAKQCRITGTFEEGEKSSYTRTGYAPWQEIAPKLIDGGFIIDKRELLETSERAVSIVMKMPMLSISLPANTHDEFSDRHAGNTFLEMIASDERTGMFGALARLGQTNGYGGLDDVSLDVFMGLWLNAGAKIGQRKGNEIHWHHGVVDHIIQDHEGVGKVLEYEPSVT